MKPLLPVRPRINKDESIIGYLTRLAKVNTYKSVAHLVSEWAETNVTISAVKRHQPVIANFLSEITGHDIKYNEARHCGRFDETITGLSGHAVSNKPCICPACIRDTGFVKAEWQFTPNSFCERHACANINVCPSCRRELKWNVALLDLTCQMCGASLAKVKEGQEPKHINMLGVKGDVKYFAKLFETAHQLLRPLDLMPSRIQKSTIMTSNWNDLYDAAAEIMSRDELPLSSYDLLFNGQGTPVIREHSISPLTQSYKSATKKELNNENSRYYVDQKTVEALTGLSPAIIQEVYAKDLVKSVFQKSHCSTFIFDFRDWHKLIDSRRKLACGGVPIEDVEKESLVFFCEPSNITLGILLGKIPCRFKNELIPNFKEAFIDRDYAHYYLQKVRGLKLAELLPIGYASSVMQMSTRQIRNLLDNDELQYFESNSKRRLISVSSIKTYLRNNPQKKRVEILKSLKAKVPISGIWY